jgi:hypothetical protein
MVTKQFEQMNVAHGERVDRLGHSTLADYWAHICVWAIASGSNRRHFFATERLRRRKSTTKQVLPRNPRDKSTEEPPKNMHTSQPASKRSVDKVWHQIERDKRPDQTSQENIDGPGKGSHYRHRHAGDSQQSSNKVRAMDLSLFSRRDPVVMLSFLECHRFHLNPRHC